MAARKCGPGELPLPRPSCADCCGGTWRTGLCGFSRTWRPHHFDHSFGCNSGPAPSRFGGPPGKRLLHEPHARGKPTSTVPCARGSWGSQGSRSWMRLCGSCGRGDGCQIIADTLLLGSWWSILALTGGKNIDKSFFWRMSCVCVSVCVCARACVAVPVSVFVSAMHTYSFAVKCTRKY